MGAACFKAANKDGPDPVNESFGSSRKAFARSPLKDHVSDAQLSAESTPRKANDGRIAAPQPRFDRETPHCEIGIECKSTTSDTRSASSSTSGHEPHGPSPDPPSVSKLSTIHSASLSHPDRSPHSDASPLSHLATGPPSLNSPRVNPVLQGSPTNAAAINVLDSLGDADFPNDFTMRQGSSAMADATVAVSPYNTWVQDPSEVTAAFGVGGVSSMVPLSAPNAFPTSTSDFSAQPAQTSSGSQTVLPSAESSAGGTALATPGAGSSAADLQVSLPQLPSQEIVSDSPSQAHTLCSPSAISMGSELAEAQAATAVSGAGAAAAAAFDVCDSMVSFPQASADSAAESADAATPHASVHNPARVATSVESPFVEPSDQATKDTEAPLSLGVVGFVPASSKMARRTVNGGAVTAVAASRGPPSGGQGRRPMGGSLGTRERNGTPLSTPDATSNSERKPTLRRRNGADKKAMLLDSGTSASSPDDALATNSAMEAREVERRGKARTSTAHTPPAARHFHAVVSPANNGNLAPLQKSTSAFSLPPDQTSLSIVSDSAMAETQPHIASGGGAAVSPHSMSPSHFAQQQQFMPAWGILPAPPMMSGNMVAVGARPGSPQMMPGAQHLSSRGVSHQRTPTAASPSSARAKQHVLSPELAALLGRDGQSNSRRPQQMQALMHQQRMLQHQHRMAGRMPMGYPSSPQAMAQMQLAAQQQQMAMMNPALAGQMRMSPQSSRTSSASSISLNAPHLQGMPMRSGSRHSSGHHSMSPHPHNHHSMSPFGHGMGNRHFSKASSEESSTGAPNSAHRHRNSWTQGGQPGTANAKGGRGSQHSAAYGMHVPTSGTVTFPPSNMHVKAASMAEGLPHRAGTGGRADAVVQVQVERGAGAGKADHRRRSRQAGPQ